MVCVMEVGNGYDEVGGGGVMEVGSGYDGSGKWVWWKWEVGMMEVGSGYDGSGKWGMVEVGSMMEVGAGRGYG